MCQLERNDLNSRVSSLESEILYLKEIIEKLKEYLNSYARKSVDRYIQKDARKAIYTLQNKLQNIEKISVTNRKILNRILYK